jgi:M6 family metalloprotease-like protein
MSAAFGESRAFAQEKGPDVILTVFGDEFYARYETTDGYTCLYDEGSGLYCYAVLKDGHFLSAGIPISAPPPAEVQPHLKEVPDVRNEKFNDRFGSLKPPRLAGEDEPNLEVYGPNAGLLTGRELSQGQVRGLAIMVDFQDVQTAITSEEVSALLNAEQYTANGNFCSVREYFRLMSSGALDYTNLVFGPVRLSQERRYYVNHSLAAEALNLAREAGLDFSQFDSQGIGAIDAVSFLYAGDAIWEGELWPHNSSLNWRSGEYRAGMFQITGLGENSQNLVIGTFCHESGHMLCRFPDLYDYGKRDGDFESSAGLGSYCLMSAGNHLNGGRTPAPICAYLRSLAGWCPNQISLNTPGNAPQVYEAVHGVYDTVFVYTTPRRNEYFMLENRGRSDLDQYLPSSGLAIYHCDIKGSNERQGGTAEQHYQCSLLQADGRLDLEKNANRGDSNDFFTLVQGEALSGSTNPSTQLWDGADSGLRIADIGAAGKTITFLVVPERKKPMTNNNSTNGLDPNLLKDIKQQQEILQANIDLNKLAQQLEQEKLKAEVDKVKLEADKQNAEADKIKALIPAGTSASLSGETKTDEKFGYIARLAVHKAVGNATREIAEQVRKAIPGGSALPPRIVLADTLDFCGEDIQALQFTRQLEALKEALCAQAIQVDKFLGMVKLPESIGEEVFIPAAASLLPAIGSVLSAVPGAMSWGADIAAYFKTEDTYTSVDVEVPNSMLQTYVASALTSSQVHPGGDKQSLAVCFPSFHTFGSLQDLPVLSKLRECAAERDALSAKSTQLKIQIDALAAIKEEDVPPVTKAQARLAEAAYTRSQTLIQSFDDFNKLMMDVPEGKSYSPLARVAMREYLKNGGEQQPDNGQAPTYLLYLNVISSSGELAIRKTLWWQREIVFLGGCVVAFVLATTAGRVLAAATVGKLIQARYTRGQAQSVQFADLTQPMVKQQQP